MHKHRTLHLGKKSGQHPESSPSEQRPLQQHRLSVAKAIQENIRRKCHPSPAQWDSSFQRAIWFTGTDAADAVMRRLLKSSASPFFGFFILILKQSAFVGCIKAEINHYNSLGYFFHSPLSLQAQMTDSGMDTPKEVMGSHHRCCHQFSSRQGGCRWFLAAQILALNPRVPFPLISDLIHILVYSSYGPWWPFLWSIYLFQKQRHILSPVSP